MRVYKRTSDNIRQIASKTISGGKDGKVEGNEQKVTKHEAQVEENVCDKENESEYLGLRNKQNLSVCQMIKNVIKTRMEMRKKKLSKGVKNASKLAKKLVKKGLKNKVKTGKSVQKAGQKRLVIDVNFNVKITK